MIGTGMAIYFFPPDAIISKAIIGLTFFFYIFVLLLSMMHIPKMSVIFVITIFFLFHSFQTVAVIMDKAILSGKSVYFYSFSAIACTVFLFYFFSRYVSNRIRLHEFMNPMEMLLFLTTFNIIFGGNDYFTDASLITFLHEQLRVFISGILEVSRRLLLLPAPDSFETPVRTFIEFFTSPRFSMALISLTVLLPPLVLLLRLLTMPEPDMETFEKRSVIRKRIVMYRTELIRRGIPILFSFVTFAVLIHNANLILSPVYEPQPVNVIPENGIIKIPLSESTGDVSDQRLRKYSFSKDGVSYRLMVMMRPDGEVIATLDACEICPSVGYIQKGRYLICKYCNTPIPSESFGLAGGCNPIPVPYKIEGDNMILDAEDVVEVSKKAGSKFTGRH